MLLLFLLITTAVFAQGRYDESYDSESSFSDQESFEELSRVKTVPKQAVAEYTEPAKLGPEAVKIDLLRFIKERGCKNLSSAVLNQIHPEHCSLLTARCIDEFDITNLPPACAMNFPTDTIGKLSFTSASQLLNSSPETMFFTVQDIEAIMRKWGTKFTSLPTTFLGYCCLHSDFSEMLMVGLRDLKHAKGITQMLSSPYIEKLDPAVFQYIDQITIKMIPPASFRLMNKHQLGKLRPDVLGRISAAQMGAIAPATMEAFTAEPMMYLEVETIRAISSVQARSLGINPDEFPEVTATTKIDRDMEVIAYRMFLERHACRAAEQRMHNFSGLAVREALTARCERVWKAPNATMLKKTISPVCDGNSSSRNSISINTGITLAVLVFLMF